MSELNIQNLGNTRIVTGRGIPKVVPEAYQFDMTFTSLILPTRNIMEGMDGGAPVQAINNVQNFQQELTNALANVQNFTFVGPVLPTSTP